MAQAASIEEHAFHVSLNTQCALKSSYYYMCPHTTMCVSSYYYICVLILVCVCPHTRVYTGLLARLERLLCLPLGATQVLRILLYMCPHMLLARLERLLCLPLGATQVHTAIYVPSYAV
jgi:magnesium-transporting ATPase (P-type)